MTEATPFPKPVKHPRQPSLSVIKVLKDLLAQAESGELTAVGFATVYAGDLGPDYEVNSGWASEPGTYHALNSAIHKLVRARGRYCDDIPEATC
jgi:hypothetical protein